MFKAILIEKDEQGYRAALKDVDDAQLPEGNVTVKVAASTLNYKDSLAITGASPALGSSASAPLVAFSISMFGVCGFQLWLASTSSTKSPVTLVPVA